MANNAQTINLDVSSQFKVKNMELIEVSINSASTQFSFGVKNMLSDKTINGIALHDYFNIDTQNFVPSGKKNAVAVTPIIYKAFVTIQDTKGIVRIKDMPLSKVIHSLGNPVYLKSFKINFEKSYIKLTEPLKMNDNTNIADDVAVAFLIYYE